MASAISKHNSKILRPDRRPEDQQRCKCGGSECPVGGKCSEKWVVYSAKVTEPVSGNFETYTGLTSRTFKTRKKEHLRDFKNSDSRIKSKLSGYIWDQKDNGLGSNIEWSIIDRTPPFNTTTRKCLLCLKEKHHIMYDRVRSSLNKRSEVFNTLCNRRQDLLCMFSFLVFKTCNM